MRKQQNRLIIIFSATALLFFLLVVRLGYHMVIKGKDYALMASRQQTADTALPAGRGSISDRNGNELAISATAYTVWVRPLSVKNHGKTEEERERNLYTESKALSELLSMDMTEVEEIITSDRKLCKLAKNIDKNTADEVRSGAFAGIEITEDAKRYYPLGVFASHALGATTDDNAGLLGLEKYYDRYLSGTDGRFITRKSRNSEALFGGPSRYYGAKDGLTLITTLDENIQYIVQQEADKALEDTGASRVMCLMTDPATGGILAMYQTGSFDPNRPREPVGSEKDKEAFNTLDSAARVEYWNKLWRNFCVSDTYEPGSTFKLITTAIALDEGVTYIGDNSFYCKGSIDVADATLKCWYYPRSHGRETLSQVVENSCNPAMVQMVQRLGIKKYYEGLDAFGLTDKTGIDYPGEGYNILQNRRSCGPVGLATMAYGQGIALTPISLVSAISSLANGGRLMKPHFVKAFANASGKIVETYEPVNVSVPVSSQTADDMLKIMEDTVDEGSGGSAKLLGYRIGGKTGTAQKPIPGGYSKTDFYGSFIGIAPIDDPKFTILVVVDTPKGVAYGSKTAAPPARRIMKRVFDYLGVEPKYSKEDLAKLGKENVKVPDLLGKSAETAIGILGGRGLEFTFAPFTEAHENLMVTDQYPKGGSEVPKGSAVTLYYEILPEENSNKDEIPEAGD